VAWKLVAVNLSDLAAKGAAPVGMLAGTGLTRDAAWNAAFVDGLGEATRAMGVPLLGGDTVVMPDGAPRTFGLTTIGRVTVAPPSRIGAAPGDVLYVVGVIGDAGLGLEIAMGKRQGPEALLKAYRRPMPLLESGRLLAGHVTAMMDVSDGLLLDANRLAEASQVTIALDPAAIPLPPGLPPERTRDALAWGDDYELLFTLPTGLTPPCPATRIGTVLIRGAHPLLLGETAPEGQLGYEHG
jgi:thiamine-monophosphate kinase